MRSVDWPGRWLQDRLGYEPRDLALFRAALTHRSASGPNNERLEFLGDAVLNLIIAHHLYAAFPQASEGDLSRLRARLVSREPLAAVERVIARLFAPRIAALPDPEALKDAKTRLQEYLQSRNLALPRYAVLNIEGEDHAQTFQVSCEAPDLGRRVLGRGSSRRRAEQEAAERMLTEIETHPAPERPA